MLVKVVDCAEDLTDRLGGILFSESALLTNAVEKLSSGRQLGHDIVLVLRMVRAQILQYTPVQSYP